MATYTFLCDEKTEQECLRRNLVGTIQSGALWALEVNPGDTILLYNFHTGDVIGPFVSDSNADCHVPEAWGGKFPMQVRLISLPAIHRANVTNDQCPIPPKLKRRLTHKLSDELSSDIIKWVEAVGTEL